MALNAAERTAVVRGILRCFGEDAAIMGRFLRFLNDVAGFNLLATIQTEALTWQPFIDSGLTISQWTAEVQRYFDLTQTNG